MKLVIWLGTNALALLVAIWLFDGITLTADTRADRIIQLLVTGAIFGAINSLVKPVLKVLSFPFIVLSLGLLLFVINALMLLLTSKIAHGIGTGFHVDGFWTAVFGAVVISIADMVIDALMPDRDHR
ncbi:MAG TPA: phage holin family protein [Marmoricola sp.]